MRIGVLYICTGRYRVFWEPFYESASRYFFAEEGVQVEYVVFTDASRRQVPVRQTVHRVRTPDLGWPDATLRRYDLFVQEEAWLRNFDYLFFFNANVRFCKPVGRDLLPSVERPLLVVAHPGYVDKPPEAFTYERDPSSSACIPEGEGEVYVMGGVNGGVAASFLDMSKTLKRNIEMDRAQGRVAVWHDESHLNRYVLDHPDQITLLGEEYGHPEGWPVREDPYIEILNKDGYGGHAFLREKAPGWRGLISWFGRGRR